MKTKSIFWLGLVLVLTMCVVRPVSAFQATFPAAGIVQRTANLRSGPATTYVLAGSLRQGEIVTVVGCSPACDWYQLESGQWIAAFLVKLNASPPPVTDVPLTVVGWNTELNDADVQVIADRMAALQGVDLWGLAEINRPNVAPALTAAAAIGEQATYASVLSVSGGGDRLLAIYDSTRFTLLASQELDEINTTGNARAPLVLHLRDKSNSTEFLFMVNHLYRTREEERYQQARLLNAWAAEQILPVIAVGDYNFDWDVQNGEHDLGYDLLTHAGEFVWIKPTTLVTTQCSGWPCQFDSVLDFVFTAGPAQVWRAESQILAVTGDFPDDATTSDHRPVLAHFWPVNEVPGTAPTLTSTATSNPGSVGTAAKSNANLRAGPGTTYAITGRVQQGQPLSIVGRNQNSDWYKLDNGAWIAASLINNVPPAASLTVSAAPTVAAMLPPTAIPVTVQPTPTPNVVQPTVAPQPPAAPSQTCDPSYPGVCIPPSPPDLDCGDIPYRRFDVIGADPHRFDGDKDGIGCES